jgi:hypothetical protein
MADILHFTGNTILPADPIEILEKAKAWGLERVVVLGWKEGGEFMFGGSHSEVAEANLLLDLGKRALIGTIEP